MLNDDLELVQLLCKDKIVLSALYDADSHSFAKIIDVHLPELVPFGARDGSGKLTRKDLNAWWRGRAIPVTRDGARETAEAAGDSLGLLEASRGLSLSDQFWVRFEGDDVFWNDVSFFTQGWEGGLGLLTLHSADAAIRAHGNLSAPDPASSTGGDLRKAWELRGGEPWLVKAGRGALEQEPVNEAIATALHRCLLTPNDFVPYSLEERDGHLYSACPDMVSEDECLVPCHDIINASKKHADENPWQRIVRCYESLGLDCIEEQLSKMFACGHIIANHDRHTNNFGVIFDASDMHALRIAPIYDSGSSLYCDAHMDADGLETRYRPKPLIELRQRQVTPQDQLAYVTDYGWLDVSALSGFADEAGEMLLDAGRIEGRRVDAVVRAVRGNIADVVSHAE